MQADNPFNLLSDALEASYYVAPEEPGLSHDELSTLLQGFGHSRNEIAEYFAGTFASERFTTVAGNVQFQSTSLPPSLSRQELTFEGDQRSVEVYTFIISQLLHFSTLNVAAVPIVFLISRGVSLKHSEASLILGIHALAWMNKVKIDNDCVLAGPDILKAPKHRLFDFLQQRISARRPRFQSIYQAVKNLIETRPENIALVELLRGLQDIKLPRAEADSPAATMLDRVLSLFADTNGPVLLDDVSAANGESASAALERAGLVRRTPEKRLVPSLAALARTPRIHRTLLLSLNALLDAALYMRQREGAGARPVGVNMLISRSRLDLPPPKILRQMKSLLNSSVLEPAISCTSEADEFRLSADIVGCRTIPKLLSYQLHSGRVPSQARAVQESHNEFATLLEHALSRALTDPMFASELRQLVASATIAPHQNGADSPSLQARIQAWIRQQPSSGILHMPGASMGTEVGARATNQDRAAIARLRTERGQDVSAFIVCDGIGGMKDGDISASTAISSFVAELSVAPVVDMGSLIEALEVANTSVRTTQRGKGGTTFSAVISIEAESYICHIGDSSIIAFDKEGAMARLTPNDTIGGQLRSMGLPNDPQADLHGRLIQYLGMEGGMESHVAPVPKDAQMLLVASDGALWPGPSVVQRVARAAASLEHFTARLLTLSLWLGAEDNSTCIALSPSAWKPSGEIPTGLVEMWGLTGKVEFSTTSVAATPPRSLVAASKRGNKERPPPRRRTGTQPRFHFTNSFDDEDTQDQLKTQLITPNSKKGPNNDDG